MNCNLVPDIVKVAAKDTVIKKHSMVYYKRSAGGRIIEYAETVWRMLRLKDFYIRKISLRNYRRFEEKTIYLNKNMNLLIGKNASGKTTVLEAVNVAMGAYLAAYKEYVPSRFVQNISDSDVRRKNQRTDQKDVLISSGIEQYPCSVETELLMDGHKFVYRRILEKKDSRTKFAASNPMQKEVVRWEKAMKASDGTDEGLILPLVLYLSSARLWNENKSSEFDDIPNRTDAYHRCLDAKRGMQMPFQYMRYMKEIAVQEKGGEDFPAYTLIMDAIQESMRVELNPGERVEYALRYKGLALVEADGTWIPFEGLSDGYRDVIKIITDIAVRMCILNPYLKENTFKETPGIVVIDELDLSLHPEWQRRIINTLTELFPKVQFICASHSPFIIQSLKKGQLISMDGEIRDEYAGQSIEDIAEDIMGVENPQYSAEKQEMYELAEDYFLALEQADKEEDLDRMKEKLNVLTARYGDNPAYYAYLNQKYIDKKAEMGSGR